MEATGSVKTKNQNDLLTNRIRVKIRRCKEYGISVQQNESTNSNIVSVTESNKSPISRYWSGSLKLPHEQQFNQFVNNLGPGQKVSRQVLGSPCLGEIKLALYANKQKLNVTVLEATNLKQTKNKKMLPSIYVKVYLYKDGNCVEKRKTKLISSTLNPLYEETLKFDSDYQGSILRVTIWGDYGKLNRKVFMGIAQIVLDDIKISDYVEGWYKLFSLTSIVNNLTVNNPFFENQLVLLKI